MEGFNEYQPLLVKEATDAYEPEVAKKRLFFAACAAAIGGTFQYGYSISVINAPTVMLGTGLVIWRIHFWPCLLICAETMSAAVLYYLLFRHEYVHNFINSTWKQRYQSDITQHGITLLWSTIVSIFTLGGLLGASIGGTMSVKIGRKGTLLANNIFALAAAVMMGLSSITRLFELLIVGRFLIGINAGIGLCVQSLYLGEIAPTSLRGSMGMATSIFITGGILTGQVMGLKEVLGREEYWPILLSTISIPAILQLLILPWFAESPRYLLIDRGDEKGCKKALRQLHGVNNCDVEFQEIEQEKNHLSSFKSMRPWELFTDRSLRWQLLTVILLSAVQQLNGINAIYFYADYVLKGSGIPVDKIPYVTVGTGVCECFTALTCGMVIDALGRKVLIMGGYILMSICCVLFTLSLTFQNSSPVFSYLSVVCVFGFILSFGLGPGGVTNLLTTELFTQTSRPAAYVITGTVGWSSFFLIGMVFPFIVLELKQYCFLVFLVICSSVAVYILVIVPETKNKTFLEIQNEFTSKKKKDCIDENPGLLSTSI